MNVDDEDAHKHTLKELKELCIEPFHQYAELKQEAGRWSKVDSEKKKILDNVIMGINNAGSINDIEKAINDVIDHARNKSTNVFSGFFNRLKMNVTSPGELYNAAQNALKIFNSLKDGVETEQEPNPRTSRK